MALLIAACAFMQLGGDIHRNLTLRVGEGDIGMPDARLMSDASTVLQTVTPGGAAERAGLRAGDHIRMLDPKDNLGPYRESEPVRLKVMTEGGGRDVTIMPKRFQLTDALKDATIRALFADVVKLITCLAAFVVILRSRNDLTLLWLGAALAASSIPHNGVFIWQDWQPAFTLIRVMSTLMIVGATSLFLVFAYRFRRDRGGRYRTTLRALVILCPIIAVGLNLPYVYTMCTGVMVFGFNEVITYFVAFTSITLSSLATLTVLVIGWREAPTGERGRYLLLATAIGLIMLSYMLNLLMNVLDIRRSLSQPLVWVHMILPLLGALLFVYAVLRHRVIDIGFAVNRALVYAGVSAIVLLAFGLSEWGLQKLLPAHLQDNLWVDATIALGIFFAFHHIQTFVEKGVENVFFRKWHDNEAALERFVTDSGFYDDGDALEKAAVAEFSRFSGGAAVRLYRREAGGYALAEGSGVAHIDSNLAALVRLRADLQPVTFDLAAGVGAALILPMLYRNEVSGFFLLELKPSGDLYRPDEVAVLSKAARKIGADLHALRIEDLEHEAHALRQALAGARAGAASA
ncbi:hypothetical protein PQU92_16485 [Asticcacaulis sp. BYS171W]|uniref:PDZ domain-containing protein n=1 Tax=Asticcacaulis aquaticus TaxID=2984212 RepID=A0ABT5HXV8_9CAUL|nr:hypothetical protein [Asticcacaulis aquaticus]MDC7684883.1 hypothetical protein [Asticcacaulis aquaticus]